MKKLTFILYIFLISSRTFADDVTIIDSRHYSNVFGEVRNFRIFLPPGYFKSDKKYPVIYFFHGWGQRYFGEGADEYAGYDKGNQNKGDNIANFVAKNDVIVVKADGYNRRKDEEYYRRPYNVLPVETYRQFPIYFPELIKYIDDHYQTIPDRDHRAVSGLSMGGFMTFVLAAKYPHLVSSAGSFCGSPEFLIGPYDFPVEYRHMDMYKNFAGINVKLNYGDKDFIRSYHQDMNKMWSQVMDNYQWAIYDAEHSTCGLGDMFESIMKRFENPVAKPARWDHTDVYPDFSVWDYNVSSDRIIPGFTVLENVDKRGFRCAVREFVPDGQLISNVQLMIVTAPVYEKNQLYTINDIDLGSKKVKQTELKSDGEGKLMISINGSLHEIGINKKTDKPEIVLANYELQDAGWAEHGKEVKVAVKLLNKGMSTAKNIMAKITAFRNNVKINNGSLSFGSIAMNESKEGNAAFSFTSDRDSLEIIKFRVDITDDGKNKWEQFFDLPIKKHAEDLNDFEIADGRMLSVRSSGIDMETILLGKGNGDGIVNPGESIVVLAKDSGKLWRTDLSFSGKFLNPGGLVTRKSDLWSNVDHVGASAKYDEVLIAADYPQGEESELYAEYWVPQYPMHIVKQGTVKIKVTGADKTPPSIEYIQYKGDNTIEAKIIDGGNIRSAIAKLIMQNDFEKTFDVQLKDDGTGGDRTAGDHIYSITLPERKFSVFRVIVDAEDAAGNKTGKENKELFVMH
jgi:S-formylglutathione hydrolase FrmB